jgi:hypothetical protein
VVNVELEERKDPEEPEDPTEYREDPTEPDNFIQLK